MAYVYQHIRLDKNEPFYIGIGTSEYYNRARRKKGRNEIWQRISSKANIKIEILFDNITWEQACEKEIELINKYGRINNKTGILANLTDGGEGAKGAIPKNKRKIVQKDFNNNIIKIYESIASVEKDGYIKSGVNMCCRGKAKIHAGYVWQYFDSQSDDLNYNKSLRKVPNRKKIIQKNLDGSIVKVWECVMDAVKVGFTSSGIGRCCNGFMKTHKGYMWEFENPAHITRKGKDNFRTYKKVIQIDPKTNMAVKVWENADRTESLGFYPGYITDCCKGKYKERYGYKWEYFDENKSYEFDKNHEIQDNKKRKEGKRIAQVDLSSNKIVNVFDSYYCVKEKGFQPSLVWRCIKKKKKNQIYRGYKWEYLHKN